MKKKKKKSKTPVVKYPSVTLVYCGVTEGDGEKLLHVYQEEESSTRETRITVDARLYGKKIRGSGGVGAVVAVDYPGKEPSSIFPSSGRFVRFLELGTRVIEWAAESDAIADELASRKAAKKDNPAFESLEPFRVAFARRRNRQQKLALLLRVVSYVAQGARL